MVSKNFLSIFPALREIFRHNKCFLLSFPYETYIVSLLVKNKKIIGCDSNFADSFFIGKLKEKNISPSIFIPFQKKYTLFDLKDEREYKEVSEVLISILEEISSPELSISINLKTIDFTEDREGVDFSEIVVEVCERFVKYEEIKNLFSNEEMPIKIEDNSLSISRSYKIKPYQGYILSRIINNITVKDLKLAANIEEEKVLKALLILWVLNLIDVDILEKNEKGGIEIPQKLLEEVNHFEKLIKTGNCFQIFDLPIEASEERIKKKYIMLTKKFHPDKFQKYEDEKFLKKIDSIFAKLTECYEKLRLEEERKRYVEMLKMVEEKKKKEQISKTGTIDNGKIKKSVGKPKHAFEDPVHKAKQHFLHGKEAFKHKKYFDATEHFRESVRMQPEKAEYQYWLGKTLAYNPKRLKEAEERLLKAIELKPDVVLFYLELARLYAKVGLHIKCKKMYEKVYELDPENEEARVYLKIKPKKKKLTFKDFLNMDLKNLKDLFKK